MIRLVENEARLYLGLAGSICKLKKRLKVMKAFVLLFLFFLLENQPA